MPKVACPFIGPNFLPLQRPLVADWTWYRQQPPDASTAATATDGFADDPQTPLVMTGTPDDATHYSISTLERPLPSSSFTIVTAQAAWGRKGVWTLPIFFRNTVSGKGAGIAWAAQGGAPAQVDVHLSGYSSADMEDTTFDNGNQGPPFSDYFMWFKATWNGSAFHFYHSPEGVIWSEIAQSSNPATYVGTFNRVGFGILRASNDLGSGLLGPQSAIVWHWIES